MFTLKGLTFKVLVLDSSGTACRNIKGIVNVLPFVRDITIVIINTSEVAKVDHGRLNSLATRSKPFSKYFASLLWEFL